MRKRIFLGASLLAAAAACVGDEGTNNFFGSDGGAMDAAAVDAPSTMNDGSSPGDAATTDGGGNTDATNGTDAGADTGPPVDGGYAFSGNWGTNSDQVFDTSLAAIPTGGFVAAGGYSGANVTFSTLYTLPTASGPRDGYVTTFDANGAVTGAISFGGTGSDSAAAVAADATGDVYVSGISFGGATIKDVNNANVTINPGMFVARLSGATLLAKWVRQFEIALPCPTCIAVNGTTVAVSATLAGSTFTYDTGKTLTSNGGYDIVLFTLDASNAGKTLWAAQIGGSQNDTADGVALDAKGDFYVSGHFTGPTLATGTNQALGNSPPMGPGTASSTNLLVAKINAAHAPVFAKAYGDPLGSDVIAAGVAADGNGHVAVGASFNGGIDFGMGKTGANGGDGIVLVLDEAQSGKTIWQQVIGSSGSDKMNAVAFDPWGHLLVTGPYENAPSIGGVQLTDAGSAFGAYLVKFGPAPTFAPEWGHGFVELGSSAGGVSPTQVAVAPSGVSAIAGGFVGATDLGSGTINQKSTAGTSDLFLAGRRP